MNSFDLLDQQIKNVLEKLNFRKPTEIQQIAIPLILEGHNVIIISPTGTGKTEAALLPVLSMLLRLKKSSHVNGILVLYITPLRALNRDLLHRISQLCDPLGIKIYVRHGDTSRKERTQQIRDPPDILITTPETLQAILPGLYFRYFLRNVRWVIIDEIHELAEDKRGSQLSLALERLQLLTSHDFQRIGLSATIGNPEEIGKFLVGVSRPFKVAVSSTGRRYHIVVDAPQPSSEDSEIAEHLYVSPEAVARIRRIIELMRSSTSCITFVNTREMAEILTSRIKALEGKFEVGIHHSSLDKEVRVDAEHQFKDKKIKMLVSTSSLEMGIDIGHVDLVIQYMSPRQVTRLIQRVGRSLHKEGMPARGVIITAIENLDDILEAAVIAKLAIMGKIEPIKIPEKPLDVLAHQIVGFLLDFKSMDLQNLYNAIIKAYPYRNLSKEEFLSVMRFLEGLGLVKIRGSQVQRTRRTWQYYYENLSMIPDTRKYDVIDTTSGRKIGTLDEEFVAEHGIPGRSIIMRGSSWKIEDISENCVYVCPIKDISAAVPSWIGEEIPVPFDVAVRVGALRRLLADAKNPMDAKKLLRSLMLSEKTADLVIEKINNIRKAELPIPSEKLIVIECPTNYGDENAYVIVIHSCFGSLVNEALGRILAALLSVRYNTSIMLSTDPYRVVLKSTRKINPHHVAEMLQELKPDHVPHLIKISVKNSGMLIWRLLHVARRFGAISRNAEITPGVYEKLPEIYSGTPVYEEALREVTSQKLDVTNLCKILHFLRDGKIGIEVITPQEPSFFAKLALEPLFLRDYVSTGKPIAEIIEYVKKRLLNERLKVLCINCLKWEIETSVSAIPENMKCPVCGSVLLAMTSVYDDETRRVLMKVKRGEELSDKELKTFRSAQLSASLFAEYGKRAAIVMAGRGIGPKTAAHILSMCHNCDIDELIKEVINAERTFLRTRRFWSND